MKKDWRDEHKRIMNMESGREKLIVGIIFAAVGVALMGLGLYSTAMTSETFAAEPMNALPSMIVLVLGIALTTVGAILITKRGKKEIEA